MTTALFDADAFAQRLQAGSQGQSLRQISEATGVSLATLSRAMNGWRDLSHENYLRLEAWLADGQERDAA